MTSYTLTHVWFGRPQVACRKLWRQWTTSGAQRMRSECRTDRSSS